MKAGLSTLLAIIVLAALAISGSLLVIFFATGAMNILWGVVQVSPENMSLWKSESSCRLHMVLKNTGTKPIESITVIIGGSEYNVALSGVLEPGKSVSADVTLPSGMFHVGKTYTVALKAKATDGSESTYATTVLCMWKEGL